MVFRGLCIILLNRERKWRLGSDPANAGLIILNIIVKCCGISKYTGSWERKLHKPECHQIYFQVFRDPTLPIEAAMLIKRLNSWVIYAISTITANQCSKLACHGGITY